MSPAVVAALVVVGFAVVLSRRRSVATVLVAVQALLLGVCALTAESGADGAGLVISGVILLVRGAVLPALFTLARRRTPEPALVVPATTMVARLLLASVVVVIAVAATPPLGLGDRAAEHGAVALLCLGITTVVTRRPALLQIIGILVAENGVYLLAISVPGGLPAVIELGVLFDVALVVTVAAAFTGKIHEEVGTGDTDLLRGLRD